LRGWSLSWRLEAENAGLRAENAELRRRLGMDSGNSSTPLSKEPLAAKAARKAKRSADRSSREPSGDGKPGGQDGHKGSGLVPAAVSDWTGTADAPTQCRGCGADLADPAVSPDRTGPLPAGGSDELASASYSGTIAAEYIPVARRWLICAPRIAG
jgi:hypothetical protein